MFNYLISQENWKDFLWKLIKVKEVWKIVSVFQSLKNN